MESLQVKYYVDKTDCYARCYAFLTLKTLELANMDLVIEDTPRA